MRKRFALLWAIAILGIALVLPASTSAASYGKITFQGGSCSGANTVHATFKLLKYSGFHATRLSMTVKGQGYYNGGWHNEYNVGTYFVNINTNGGYYYKDTFFFKPGHSGSHRILAIGKIWNGSHLVASGKAHSGYCG